MTYAIVEASGTQLWLEPGRFYDVNRLDVPEDESVTLDKVLFIENEGEANVGSPYVDGASVEATVIGHPRGRKVIVYKMRPKKKTRRKQGHRQELTRILINSITLNGQVIASDDGAELLVEEPESSPVAEAEVEVEATTEPVETVEDEETETPEAEASDGAEVEAVEESDDADTESSPVAEAEVEATTEPVETVEDEETETPEAEASDGAAVEAVEESDDADDDVSETAESEAEADEDEED